MRSDAPSTRHGSKNILTTPLRHAIYFVLGGMMGMFHYLKLGLGGVLSFIGVKMLLRHSAWKIDTLVALGVVAGILAASVIASLVHAARARARLATPPAKANLP